MTPEEQQREIDRLLNGPDELSRAYDKERKQRERAGFKSKLASLDFGNDEGTNYLWEMAEGKELGDGLQPKEGLRFTVTPHDVAVEVVDWLLRQKPHGLTDDEWTYLHIRGCFIDDVFMTRERASVHLGYAPGWGSRFEARMRERFINELVAWVFVFDALGLPFEHWPPASKKPRWEPGGPVIRFRAKQYGNGHRMRPLLQSFESVPIHGHSLRNGAWIDVGRWGKAKAWGRPTRSASERRREVYEMQMRLADTRHLEQVVWFTSFTEGTYTRVVKSGEELALKRPYILGGTLPVHSAHPDETSKVVNMSGSNGDKMIQYGKWEVYAFECYPNGKREVWYSAKNGGPPVYANTPRRLVEKMKAAH